MHSELTVADAEALQRALDVCGNPRAEFSSEIGPALRDLRRVVETLTLDAVRHARERRGNSWTEVGAGLGMTRQGAQRKYGDRVA